MVTSTPWLLEALRAARDVDPPTGWSAGACSATWSGTTSMSGLVCRRNPRRVSVAHYRQRVRDKRIAERWPRVEVTL